MNQIKNLLVLLRNNPNPIFRDFYNIYRVKYEKLDLDNSEWKDFIRRLYITLNANYSENEIKELEDKSKHKHHCLEEYYNSIKAMCEKLEDLEKNGKLDCYDKDNEFLNRLRKIDNDLYNLINDIKEFNERIKEIFHYL